MLSLQGLELWDADAALASFSDSLWHTAAQATSWLRMEGEIILAFAGSKETYNYHRTFPAVELIGLTLWGPQRMMLAYYSQWAKCWIDRGGAECERILFASCPSSLAMDSAINRSQSRAVNV